MGTPVTTTDSSAKLVAIKKLENICKEEEGMANHTNGRLVCR